MSYDRTGRPADFDINKIIEELTGSTQSLDDVVESNYPGMEWVDLTTEDHNAIDNAIFLCAECGWWCETHEANDSSMGEDICNDCAGDEDE